MARGQRRHDDATASDGVTAVLLVEDESGDPQTDLAATCRQALRQVDAVVERHDGGALAVLLRHVRDGERDVAIVAQRIHEACDGGSAVLIATAIARRDDEPLDVLLKRADRALDSRHSSPRS